jgi:hypothetical protein
MLRLELEAQVANAQAEVEAMAADLAVEQGLPLTPNGAAQAVPAADAPDAETPAVAAAVDGASDDHEDEAPPA